MLRRRRFPKTVLHLQKCYHAFSRNLHPPLPPWHTPYTKPLSCVFTPRRWSTPGRHARRRAVLSSANLALGTVCFGRGRRDTGRRAVTGRLSHFHSFCRPVFPCAGSAGRLIAPSAGRLCRPRDLRRYQLKSFERDVAVETMSACILQPRPTKIVSRRSHGDEGRHACPDMAHAASAYDRKDR